MKIIKRILIFTLCLLLFLPQVARAETQQNKTIDLIKNKVRFVNPIDAFTLYAFMNYTGYDHENHTEFHPVRKGIREELKSMDIDDWSSLSFYFNY